MRRILIPALVATCASFAATNTTHALGTVTWDKCDPSQAGTIIDAANAALELAIQAQDAFWHDPYGERAQRWFGEMTDERYYKIREMQQGIIDKLTSSPMMFTCGTEARCGYAEAKHPPDENFFGIHFWLTFFWTPPGGYTHAEVVLHEVAHQVGADTFDAGCDDRLAAHALAQSDPDRAINCAYNHQFFAMDAPTDVRAEVCYWNWE